MITQQPRNEAMPVAERIILGDGQRRPSTRRECAPRPIGILDRFDPGPMIEIVRQRINRLSRTGAGSYLFIDPGMRVFVLSELQSITAAWLRDQPSTLVAFYTRRTRQGDTRCPDGSFFLQATPQGILDDVLQHLADMRICAAPTTRSEYGGHKPASVDNPEQPVSGDATCGGLVVLPRASRHL